MCADRVVSRAEDRAPETRAPGPPQGLTDAILRCLPQSSLDSSRPASGRRDAGADADRDVCVPTA